MALTQTCSACSIFPIQIANIATNFSTERATPPSAAKPPCCPSPCVPCQSATNQQASVAAAVKINGKIYARFRFSLLLPLSSSSPVFPHSTSLLPPLFAAFRFYYERRFAASFDRWRWLQRRRGHAGYAAATEAATATAAAAGTGHGHVKHGRWLA